MKIRLANLDDAETLSLLNNEVQDIHAREFPQIFKPPSKDTFSASEISDLIKKENCIILVAEASEQIIGYIFAEITNFPETSIRYNIDVLYIQHITVKKDFRTQGVGRLLIKNIVNFAKEKSISMVMLDVWLFNKQASDFFKKLGFSVFNERMWMYI